MFKVNDSQIIDLSTLENRIDVTNSEYILAIMEVCLNQKKYNIKSINSTRTFWDEVFDNDKLLNVFQMFKNETLRKYWRILRKTGNYDEAVKIIKKNKEIIDTPGFCLLPLINAVAI